jgi:uncharacterized membrane protein
LCLECVDFATDAIACSRVLRGNVKASSELYKVAYVTVLIFGTVGIVVSVAYRLRSAALVRAHVHMLALKDLQRCAEVISEARRGATEFEWELEQTHRTKVSLSLALMTVVLQGAF